jgi:hypothetical protein
MSAPMNPTAAERTAIVVLVAALIVFIAGMCRAVATHVRRAAFDDWTQAEELQAQEVERELGRIRTQERELPPDMGRNPGSVRRTDWGARVEQMTAYLDDFALGLMRLPADDSFETREGESVAAVRTRIARIAREVAWALLGSSSGCWSTVNAQECADGLGAVAPIWKDDNDGRHTGRLAMCVAFYESRFRGYVDDGLCNDPAWRASPEGRRRMRLGGDCDGGRAHTVWQMHNFPAEHPHAGGWYLDAPGMAIERMRYSIQNGMGLRGYTGETSPDAPKARQRLECAENG